MRPYLELARSEFARYSTYRMAILAGVFTNTVFGLIRVSVLIAAITAAGGAVAGYGVEEASTYVWLGQAFLAPIMMYGWSEIADRVQSGQIAVDLARPVDLQLAWWARDLGRAAFALPTRGLPRCWSGRGWPALRCHSRTTALYSQAEVSGGGQSGDWAQRNAGPLAAGAMKGPAAIGSRLGDQYFSSGIRIHPAM